MEAKKRLDPERKAASRAASEAAEAAEAADAFNGVDDPWGGSGQTIEQPTLGMGFVKWLQYGDHVRGFIRQFFKTRYKGKEGVAFTLELTEPAAATILHKDQETGEESEIVLEAGALTNVGIGAGLERLIKPQLLNEEVGIQYVKELPVAKGMMKVFRVKVFTGDDLPF